MQHPSECPQCSLMTLMGVFLRIGTLAFGVLGAALALIERELVSKRRYLTEADITAALTYTKLLPGSTVVQVVAYLGYLLGGWRVSALITAAFVVPAALLMLVLAAAYVGVTAQPALRPAVQGLTAAVVGVLLATTSRLGKANIEEALTLGIALAAFLAGAFLSIHAALIVTIAGLLGSVVLTAPQQEGKP